MPGVISLYNAFVTLDKMASHYLLCFFSGVNHYISRVVGGEQGFSCFFVFFYKTRLMAVTLRERWGMQPAEERE